VAGAGLELKKYGVWQAQFGRVCEVGADKISQILGACVRQA